jgi:3-oxoadipate enol-lactonase
MSHLAYTLDGPDQAPVLVLSSSLGTTRDMWLPQLPTLLFRWRVLRFDHPGHGESPIWPAPVTVSAIGQAVIDLLQNLDCHKVSFCGLSLGGAVAQWLGANAPERIERLILCCTAASFAADVYRQRAVAVREQGIRPLAGSIVDRWFAESFRRREPEVVESYRAMLESIPAEGYAGCCEAVARFDGHAMLGRIRAPTLVIAGAKDIAVPMERSQALSAGIAGARLQIVPDAAHLANVEQPEAVAAAIVEHLEGE